MFWRLWDFIYYDVPFWLKLALMLLCFICFMLCHAFLRCFSTGVLSTTCVYKKPFSVLSCPNCFQHFLFTALPADPGRACLRPAVVGQIHFHFAFADYSFSATEAETVFSNFSTSHYLIAGPGKDQY